MSSSKLTHIDKEIKQTKIIIKMDYFFIFINSIILFYGLYAYISLFFIYSLPFDLYQSMSTYDFGLYTILPLILISFLQIFFINSNSITHIKLDHLLQKQSIQNDTKRIRKYNDKQIIRVFKNNNILIRIFSISLASLLAILVYYIIKSWTEADFIFDIISLLRDTSIALIIDIVIIITLPFVIIYLHNTNINKNKEYALSFLENKDLAEELN